MSVTKELFDVVVYEMASRKIIARASINLSKTKAAEKTDTLAPRLDDDHNVTSVVAGKFHVGDLVA